MFFGFPEDPSSRAMLGLGIGLLNASQPRPYRTGFGPALAAGLLSGLEQRDIARKQLAEEQERIRRARLSALDEQLKYMGLVSEMDRMNAPAELARLFSQPDFATTRVTRAMPLGSDEDNSVADVSTTTTPLPRDQLAAKIIASTRNRAAQEIALKSLLSAKGFGTDGNENEMIKRAKEIKRMYAEDGKDITNEQAYALAQSSVVVGGIRYVPDGKNGWMPLVNTADAAINAGTVESGKSQGRKFGESIYTIKEGVDASGNPTFAREIDLLGGLPPPPPTRFRNFDPRAGLPSMGLPPQSVAPPSPGLGMPNPDIHIRSAIENELRRETDPDRRAMLQRELDRLGPAVGGAPTAGPTPPAGIALPGSAAPSAGVVRPKPTPDQEAEAAAKKSLATKDAELRIELKKKKPVAKARLEDLEATIDRSIEMVRDLLRDEGLPAITGTSALSLRIPFVHGKNSDPFALYNIEGSRGFGAAQKLKRLRERAFIETISKIKALSDDGSTGMSNLNMPEVEAFKGFENTLVPGISHEQMVQQLLDIIIRLESMKKRARSAFNERFSGIED